MAIKILKDSVARRIAAGEVIDRPYSGLRELMDNAIDAGANNITVHLKGGGIDEIQVADDGCGMGNEDLALCYLPHATSKIEKLDDLEKTVTLGFRGEALASLSTCSKLEITTSTGKIACSIAVRGGKILEQGGAARSLGTTVTVRDLFFNMPARKQFLKSAGAEGKLCRRVFMEKAAAHPDLNFRLFSDGQLKSYLPAATQKDRVKDVWPQLVPAMAWWESSGEGAGFKASIVHARPEMSRRDRQYVQIYANRRRIDEFTLVQGITYAYDAWMPGGTFPIAFAFIEIDPKLVDFNIHPAKKEARFRDMPGLRHGIVSIIREKLTSETGKSRLQPEKSGDSLSQPERPRELNLETHGREWNHKPDRSSIAAFQPASYAGKSSASYSGGPGGKPAAVSGHSNNRIREFANTIQDIQREKISKTRIERFNPEPLPKNMDFHYLGQAMNLFLIAESAGSIYIVDQHAAHERILFERFRLADPIPEPLLIPHSLKLDRDAAMRLELRRERLEGMGMAFKRLDDGTWELTALPQAARGLEEEIMSLLEDGSSEPEALEKEMWANLACKAAVKDNDVLDDEAAKKLLADAFNLDVPRCPHGRPIWFELSREELFELMGRTV